MDIGILLVITAFLWLLFASISDLRTREVPDWISYSLIAIGISFNLISYVISSNTSFLINPLFGFLLCFIIANLMYYSRQWGGGDAKLLMGLGILLSSYPKPFADIFNPTLYDLPFIVTFLMNLLVIASLYGILWVIYLALKNYHKLKENFSKIMKQDKKARYIVSFVVLALLLFSFFIDEIIKFIVILSSLLLFTMFYFSLLIKSVEDVCMFKKLPVQKLTEGDWVLEKVYINKELIYTPRKTGLTKEDISLLMRHEKKIHYVIVKEGLPFVPAFLITLIVSIIFGNIIIYVAQGILSSS